MITYEEFLIQNPQLESCTVEEKKAAYDSFVEQENIKAVQALINRVMTATDGDWSLIAAIHPMTTSDYQKEFVENLTEEIVAKIETESVIIKQKQQQEKTNAESLAYLSNTDWYVIRFAESQKEIPQEVLEKRAAARLAIIKT